MNTVQLLLDIFMYHSNWAVSVFYVYFRLILSACYIFNAKLMILDLFSPVLSRFAPLRLVTSPTQLYKRLEEFGKGYDDVIKDMVNTDSK